jgi:hypothetical protein
MRRYLCWLLGHGREVPTYFGSQKVCEFCHKVLVPSRFEIEIDAELKADRDFLAGERWADAVRANRGPRI